MRTEVNINPDMLSWAITRAGFDIDEFTVQKPFVRDWMDGNKKPTVKQLEQFSKNVYLPFGYLFLQRPPLEKLPIPFFRTLSNTKHEVSINVFDTVLEIQKRQDWLKDYLAENDFEQLDFVGKYSDKKDVAIIVADIRRTLDLPEMWAKEFSTWQDALSHLSTQIEDKGIVMIFNGVVGNNTHRKIPVEECRGFVLVDKYAPFMFINNDDYKSAQMFTIGHELAHIWIGKSAGFDFRKLQPANDPNEILCDKIAAEFLVPEKAFNSVWEENKIISKTAKIFKVSQIVIARRALDTGKISKSQFFKFYEEYSKAEKYKKDNSGSGGDFYATARKRVSVTFASHVNNALKANKLLYRDAYKLTGLKGDTFEKFFSKQF